MQKIRRGDDVIVIAGRDKGKCGKVLKILPDNRILVSEVNLVRKHKKPNPKVGEPGGLISIESPIHISNLAIFNSTTGKRDKVRFVVSDDGSKDRVYKSNNKSIFVSA